MTDKAKSRLLSLPPELRNNIYELVFTDNVVHVNTNCVLAAPGILLSCKQTYSEAVAIHYATSTFICSDYPTILASHLQKLPAKFLQRLQNVVCDVDDNEKWISCSCGMGVAATGTICSCEARGLLLSAFWSQYRLLQFRQVLEQQGLCHLAQRAKKSVALDYGGTMVHTQTPWQTFYETFATEEAAAKEFRHPHLLEYFVREHESAISCWCGWFHGRNFSFRCDCPAVRDPVHHKEEHSSEERAA